MLGRSGSTTPDETSPLGLIQEELWLEPWRLLVACLMLNQTSIKQVRPIIFPFFERWPTPEAASSADPSEMEDAVRHLGLQRRRTRLLMAMSLAFPSWDGVDVTALPGVGKYAADSYEIFVRRRLVPDPTDKELIKYVGWAKGEGQDGGRDQGGVAA